MIPQRGRLLQGAMSVALGGLSLAGVGPLLGVAADPSVCLGLSPQQSWIGLHLHLVSASPACADGGYVATESLAPAVGVTVAVSISALLVGLVTLALGLSWGVLVRRTVRRVTGWLRRHWLPVLSGRPPLPGLVPVRVYSRPLTRSVAREPVQRRGPPRGSC